MAEEGAQPADPRRADRPLVPPALDRLAAWSWRVLLVGVAVVVVTWVLARLRLVVLPLILALLIASVLHPPVRFLKARKWPPALATWTVLLVVIGGLVGLGFAAAPAIVDEFADLGPTLEEAVETIEDWLINGPLHLTRSSSSGSARTPRPSCPASSPASSSPARSSPGPSSPS
jgi:predicted PurR-regulated permease PerM